MVSGRITRLSKFLAYPLVNLSWALGIQRSKTTADLDVLRYPALLSTGKLEQATGYRPTTTLWRRLPPSSTRSCPR